MEMTRDALLAVLDSSKRAEELRKMKEVGEQSGPPGSESDEQGVGGVDTGREEKLDGIRDDLVEEGQEMGLSELLTQESLASPPPS